MTKQTFIYSLAIGLLISNLILVAYIFCNKGQHHPKHSENRDIIIEKLGFDRAQIASYDSLIQWHRKEIRSKEDEMLVQKNILYGLLKGRSTEQQKDTLISNIAKIQKDIEQIHFQHFGDIKKLCKSEQLNDYDSLLSEIGLMFSKRREKPMR